MNRKILKNYTAINFQILYLPVEYPHKKFMFEECPNLVALVERIKTKLWPDWENICENRDRK